MKIALISCTSKKKNCECKAEEMYSPSVLFRLTLKYIMQQKFDKIYILSAKYGLIKLDDEIKPYNLTLNRMNKANRVSWSVEVSKEINKIIKKEDKIYIFAGIKYYELLTLKCQVDYPLYKLRVGKRLQYLKNNIK